MLHLHRGHTYTFCIEEMKKKDNEIIPEHLFMFTNSPSGGEKSLIIRGGFSPISEGNVRFKVNKSTPNYFFYQNSNNKYEGGIVIVHD